ncbi:methyltransferase domain-containing protein [Maledivibacter halophilus]|uniref:Methylase involved in ubiquinone/menaquinone biosynthesis n=1 Tax=Maledivibacter halophilus TaxID=36842 RepID=A0A1T5MM77_9FIRM|nr:methyltransferase domain-containing protein [Maledivibacter halophilus]SKC89321.1 Methylase involved in ubiquinone/menaquinone biosynthesis [Maledivibacter halophilus]
MDCNILKQKWLLEENKKFKGWDFSYLDGRLEEEKLPWDYKSLISKYLNKDDMLLDMGTGGGEILLSLKHIYTNTSVTEGWQPNLKLCKETLEPLGITVKQVFDDKKLPFDDNTFNMVINRHEDYDAKEVRRILKNNGIFITQQVGGKNNEKLSRFLIHDFKSECHDFELNKEVNRFKNLDFSILYENEYFPYLKFFDVGAIVYFANIIEWEFPNFSVEKCFDKLCELESKIKTNGYVESIEHRFIIAAKNNK